MPPPERGGAASPDLIGAGRVGVPLGAEMITGMACHRPPPDSTCFASEANAVDPGSGPGQALPLAGGGIASVLCSRDKSGSPGDRHVKSIHCSCRTELSHFLIARLHARAIDIL